MKKETPDLVEIDPVCGAMIQRDHAEALTLFHETMYYFCSPECRDEFESHPEKYAVKAA